MARKRESAGWMVFDLLGWSLPCLAFQAAVIYTAWYEWWI